MFCYEVNYYQFQIGLGTDATKPLNFNKRQSPRPLSNVVSHFSSDLMCFGLSNIDWGLGGGEGVGCGIACKKL
jgi:hypothetical protein